MDQTQTAEDGAPCPTCGRWLDSPGEAHMGPATWCVAPTAEIDAVVSAHQFRSTSTVRAHINTHHAGCTCDPALEFDWYEREAQYRTHLLAAVYEAGRASVTTPGQDRA